VAHGGGRVRPRRLGTAADGRTGGGHGLPQHLGFPHLRLPAHCRLRPAPRLSGIEIQRPILEGDGPRFPGPDSHRRHRLPAFLSQLRLSGGRPLAQRGHIGWKSMTTCVILNDAWMVRAECGVTD